MGIWPMGAGKRLLRRIYRHCQDLICNVLFTTPLITQSNRNGPREANHTQIYRRQGSCKQFATKITRKSTSVTEASWSHIATDRGVPWVRRYQKMDWTPYPHAALLASRPREYAGRQDGPVHSFITYHGPSGDVRGRLTSSAFSRISICAPFMLSVSPLCLRPFSWHAAFKGSAHWSTMLCNALQWLYISPMMSVPCTRKPKQTQRLTTGPPLDDRYCIFYWLNDWSTLDWLIGWRRERMCQRSFWGNRMALKYRGEWF